MLTLLILYIIHCTTATNNQFTCIYLNEFFSYYFSAIISFTGNQQHPRRDQFSAYDRSTQDHISRWIGYAGLFGYPRRQCRPQSHQLLLPPDVAGWDWSWGARERDLWDGDPSPTNGSDADAWHKAECVGVLFNEKPDDVDVAPRERLHPMTPR